MPSGRVAHRWACGAALLLAAASGACGEAEPEPRGYLTYEVHALTGAEPELAGGGCLPLPTRGTVVSSSGAADGSGDFVLEDRVDDSGYTLTVRSAGEVIEERHFDEEFVARRDRVEFEVTTDAGVVYSFVYWGAPTCELALEGE